MKKRLISLLLVVVLLLSACNMQKEGDYKRISLVAETVGDNDDVVQTNLVRKAKVESIATETYSDKMPVYKIIPRTISQEEFQKIVDFWGIDEPLMDSTDERFHASSVYRDKSVSVVGNEISCSRSDLKSEPITKSDEELKEDAKAIFDTLPLIEGDYECLGVTSLWTVYENSESSYVETKRVSFRRLIDGVRVIGNDICDFYFNANGLYMAEIRFFDYEKIDEFDMMTLDEAISKVKAPDAFVLESDTNKNFSGAADKLTIKRTKLLFVNQYSDGCEILQPVYNLMGTAENAGGSVDFSSRIIAIPEKYTYTAD